MEGFHCSQVIVILQFFVFSILGDFQHATNAKNTFNRTSRISPEKRLIKDILGYYEEVGRSGRPIINISDVVSVFFGLGLIQLDLDERAKVLTLSMWTRYSWTDQYLTWDPLEYGNVSTFRIEPHLIWSPDIKLYNTAELDIAARDALAVISSNGHVSWFPHTIFKSSCSVDVTNFPFDKQQCHMWFGSWTYTSNEIDLQMDVAKGIDLSTFTSDHKESCAWNIVNVTSKREIMPSIEDTPNYVVLTFDINMERKLVFSSYILTLPCVFLACLTLVVFWLPPDRPDRTALAMSTFSSFMVLLLILVEAAPPTSSSVPTIGVYYCFNMVIIMLSIILSSLVVNISRGGRNGKPVPRWLSFLTNNIMATLLCIKKCNSVNKKFHREISSNITQKCENGPETIKMMEDNIPDLHHLERPSSRLNSNLFCHCVTDGTYAHALDRQMTIIQKVIQQIDRRMVESDSRRDNVQQHINEWLYTAAILDRGFFVMYLLLIAISLSLLFPKPVY